MIGKAKGGKNDYSLLRNINASAEIAMTALSEMERGTNIQKRYGEMLKAVYLHQERGERPLTTLKRLGIQASYKQYSSAELNIARIINDIHSRRGIAHQSPQLGYTVNYGD